MRRGGVSKACGGGAHVDVVLWKNVERWEARSRAQAGVAVVHDGVCFDVCRRDLVDAARTVARVGEDVEARRRACAVLKRGIERTEHRHRVDERLVRELERDARERRLDGASVRRDERLGGGGNIVHVLKRAARRGGSVRHGVCIELDLVLDDGRVRGAERCRHGGKGQVEATRARLCTWRARESTARRCSKSRTRAPSCVQTRGCARARGRC